MQIKLVNNHLFYKYFTYSVKLCKRCNNILKVFKLFFVYVSVHIETFSKSDRMWANISFY